MIKIKKYILRAAKNRILFTFVIVAFVMVLMPIMAEASTSSQAYYRSFINANRNAYGKRYAPAQKLSEGEIDLSTGEVSIDEVDVSLPGKGGLNLDIHRIYSSHETEYYHQYFEMTKKRVVRGKAYPFKVMDGSNRTVYLSFAEEEDLIDTVYTTAEQLNYDNWETDDYGLVYKEYINVRVANGDLLLERNKTMEPDNLNYYKSIGISYFPKTDANISLSSKSLWKIAIPHVVINECSLRTDIGKIFYYRFGDEKGRMYDLKFYLVGKAEEQIWYPEGGVAVYGSDYTGELTVDEENLNYILTLMDRENNTYRFDLGNLRLNDAKTAIATSISDRFGNKITYNGNEIIDTYGRKLRVSANGIEIYNGNNYKYIVKYNTERIIDADRDPYDVLTIFNKTKLTVSRNTSDLYSSEDLFEDTIYVTQAQETDCWLANYYHSPIFLLKEVIYPEGLKVEYKYETTATAAKEPINYPDDKDFLYKVPRVLEKIEYNQTDTEYGVKSKRMFSYEDSGTIFQEIFTPTLAVTENVYYGDNNANKKFVHNFDVFGRLLSQKQINVRYMELEKKEYMYDYDSDAYEIRSVDKLDYMYYRQEYVKIVKTTGKGTDFVYTAYTSDRKLLVEQIGLQKTTYTYDSTYRFLTGSTRQIDFDHQLKMVGTKTADGKNIAKAETFEVIGETETLQGVTEYTYNQDGTVASETVKLNSNGDTVRTDYTYDYSLFENPQNGKHSVTATVTTTDASGITRTESNTVEYDLLGNVTKEIDAGGNETEYKYDLMRRVTEEVYADGTKRSIEYNTVSRTVTATEPNGKKFTYEYDPSGNHIRTYMPDAHNQMLEEYDYDDLDRKISAKAYIDGMSV